VATNSKRKKPARKESTAVKIPLDFETAMDALLRVPRAEIEDHASSRRSKTVTTRRRLK
jgi:hypothetical protein